MNETKRVVPGSWYAVLGERVSVAVPKVARARVAALWEVAENGTFGAVLDTLVSDGVSTLPGFVLVEHAESTRVLVRGGARVTLCTDDGETVVTAPSDSIWAEADVADVRSYVIDLESADGEPAVLSVGVVPAGSISYGVHADVAAALGGSQATPEVVVAESEPFPEPAPIPDPPPIPEPAPIPVPEPWPIPDPTPIPDPAPIPDPPPIPEPEPALLGGEGSLMPGIPATAPGFVAPASPPAPLAHDGDTRFGAPYDSQPLEGEPSPAASVLSKPVASLVFSTGEVVGVDRAILVGRAPETRRYPADDQPLVISVPSPHQEISSTHLEIRPGSGVDHGVSVVTDLGSTNGTILVQPGLPAEELQPGIAVALIPGAILDLGDGVTIQTTNP